VTPRQRGLTRIRATSSSRPDLGELWRFRDLILVLGVRDVRVRYRQTALGVAWVVLQPLLAALVFTFVFRKVAGLSSEGVPYVLFAYSGMLAWGLVSGVVSRMTNSVLTNSQLISKVYVPRLALPLSTIFSSLVDLVVGSVVLVALIAWYGAGTGLAVLLLPVWLLLLVLLGTGVGLCAAALVVRFRDIAHAVGFGLQLVLYGSPVAYATSSLPAAHQAVYSLNPLVGLLDGFRWSLLGTPAPDARVIGWAVAVSVAVFVSGLLVFARRERGFADVI
jgi:lipopolysaccharide transport system permease protein